MTIDLMAHKAVLIQILKDLFTNPTIGPLLGFKGGTAAMLFYGLDRFSVDLDLDILDVAQREYLFSEIKNLLTRYGTIKSAYKKRYSLTFVLVYEGKTTGSQNVKIELNCREFGSQYEVKHYLGIPMKVITTKDMFAHKLVAMYERLGQTNRDLYDVWFFLKQGWEVNQAIVEARTGMDYSVFLGKCIELVENIPQRGKLSGMGEFLNEEKKTWVRNHLRDELLFQLRLHRSLLVN